MKTLSIIFTFIFSFNISFSQSLSDFCKVLEDGRLECELSKFSSPSQSAIMALEDVDYLLMQYNEGKIMEEQFLSPYSHSIDVYKDANNRANKLWRKVFQRKKHKKYILLRELMFARIADN